MPASPLLYYITDRKAFGADEPTRCHRLLDKIEEAASHGVDYIQLREKDLATRELESLAREAISLVLSVRTQNRELRTVFLINSRTDVALAVGAHGVHHTAADVSPAEVRAAWNHRTAAAARDSIQSNPIISVSCHSLEEVSRAVEDSATLAVFAPVFEKKDAPESAPTGLNALREACRASIPVLALGGITLQNAESCLNAGAAGVAAIRLFQENEIGTVVRQLRG